LKKIKVTKRVRAKVPWYERPPLLFGAIAVLLAGAGLLMAHLNRGSNSPEVLGTGERTDGTSAPAQGEPATDWHAEAPDVLAAGAELPPASPGKLLPPVRIETLGEAARVRERFRKARELERLAFDGDPSGGAPGGRWLETDQPVWTCVPADSLLSAFSPSASEAAARAALVPSAECRPCCDFEVHRDRDGGLYLLAFVDLETAEALGGLAPDLALPPAPPAEESAGWQFWKRRQNSDRGVWQGGRILLHPDLDPEAVCAVVLPAERLAVTGFESARAGISPATRILEARLR